MTRQVAEHGKLPIVELHRTTVTQHNSGFRLDLQTRKSQGRVLRSANIYDIPSTICKRIFHPLKNTAVRICCPDDYDIVHTDHPLSPVIF